MADPVRTARLRFWFWLIRAVGVVVPRRLRGDWRREWEAELRHREAMLAEWDRLDWRARFDLLRRSTSAFWDALWLQPKRLEDEMLQDLRFGARMLVKNPGFTTVAIITLALGIGANTAIFSVINAVLLRSLPFTDAERLVMIWETHPEIPRVGAPIPDFQDWRAQAQSFEEMAVHADRLMDAVLVGKGESAQVQGSYISQNLFPMLGLKPALGRNFLPEEEQRDKNHVVILSQATWRQELGIRMALGAKPSDVLRLVIGRGMAPVLLGMACGFAGAITVLSVMGSLTAGLLFEVRAIDPATFASIALLLLGVALLACWLPARKAMKVDPLVAIRHE